MGQGPGAKHPVRGRPWAHLSWSGEIHVSRGFTFWTAHSNANCPQGSGACSQCISAANFAYERAFHNQRYFQGHTRLKLISAGLAAAQPNATGIVQAHSCRSCIIHSGQVPRSSRTCLDVLKRDIAGAMQDPVSRRGSSKCSSRLGQARPGCVFRQRDRQGRPRQADA